MNVVFVKLKNKTYPIIRANLKYNRKHVETEGKKHAETEGKKNVENT